MTEEVILQGYCRCLDASRTVMVEEGEPDCAYENCTHRGSCSIAEQIDALQKEDPA